MKLRTRMIAFLLLLCTLVTMLPITALSAFADGEPEKEEPQIDDNIVRAYGRDKVDDLIRRQETQNYFILNDEQLDSDDAIRMVESSPAFKRDKRKVAASKSVPDSAPDKPRPSAPNEISFNLDDR